MEGITTMINWHISKSNFDKISKIADRAETLGMGMGYERRLCIMDLTATHCNGNPLDLDGLLTANVGDFAHDLYGIRDHLDRDTGKLRDFFSPRYSET